MCIAYYYDAYIIRNLNTDSIKCSKRKKQFLKQQNINSKAYMRALEIITKGDLNYVVVDIQNDLEIREKSFS